MELLLDFGLAGVSSMEASILKGTPTYAPLGQTQGVYADGRSEFNRNED